MTPVSRRASWPRLLLLVVWGLSAIYAFRTLDRGWIPHDEGTLAESAERVLEGQLPHRDYDELYTGGLTVMNAVAFRVLGVNLLTPRLVLFAFFLLWVPVLYWISSRFAPPPLAALATLLGVAWSIPNYPAAMPSWYNLFFATFGLAALLRFVETERARWLAAAGLAGGLSVLMKTSGLFFVAAALLFLAYREQESSAAQVRGEGDRVSRSGHVAFSIGATTLLVVFVALLTLLVTQEGWNAAELLLFVVPLGGIALFLACTEWLGPARPDSRRRLGRLVRLGLPFLAGFAVPIGALVLTYAAHGALGDLARGLFEKPRRRLAFAAAVPPSLTTWWVVPPFLAVVLLDLVARERVRLGGALLVVAITVAVVVAPASRAALPSLWYLMNALGPVLALAGLAVLAHDQTCDLRRRERQKLMAALAVAGGVSLIQFPFAGAIYLFYALPTLVPAALALRAGEGARARPVLVAVLAFFLCFSVRWINTGVLFSAGHFPYDPAAATVRLDLPRGGGLRVTPAQKEEYEKLVAAMRSLTNSPWTFATPDVPEVYFLSGLRNPTRTLFDFLDRRAGRSRRILRTLDAHHVNVVVLNRKLTFSGPPPPALLEGLRARYPKSALIGDFILRWRPTATDSAAASDSLSVRR